MGAKRDGLIHTVYGGISDSGDMTGDIGPSAPRAVSLESGKAEELLAGLAVLVLYNSGLGQSLVEASLQLLLLLIKALPTALVELLVQQSNTE